MHWPPKLTTVSEAERGTYVIVFDVLHGVQMFKAFGTNCPINLSIKLNKKALLLFTIAMKNLF